MENQNRLNEFSNKMIDLIEEYGKLPSYEIATRLIATATSIMLYTAPDELVGMKSIMAAITIGISEYQEDFS